MELRVLQYFIEIVNSKSISAAAEKLHISQSTLSRQIKDMENELGVVLFIRGHREISLTQDGYFLFERAQEINNLSKSTELSLQNGKILSGELFVGAGEGKANSYLTRVFKILIAEGENVMIHFDTQDADQIFKNIDSGVLDFGVVYTSDPLNNYQKLTLPFENEWGIVVPRDSELGQKESIVATDLKGSRFIVPRQLDVHSQLISYLEEYVSNYHISGTYDMNYNMRAMVESGVGIAITFDKPEYNSGPLAFKPITYLDKINTYLIWQKTRTMTRLADEFLKKMIGLDKSGQ